MVVEKKFHVALVESLLVTTGHALQGRAGGGGGWQPCIIHGGYPYLETRLALRPCGLLRAHGFKHIPT